MADTTRKNTSRTQPPRVFPVPFSPDALPDFKHVAFLECRGDPSLGAEIDKLKEKWPSEGRYYRYFHLIPELHAYYQEVLRMPPSMKPGSFAIPFFTEGSDQYSIRLIPDGVYPVDAPDFTRFYSLFILKGTIDDDGQIQGEIVLYPKDSRFVLESCTMDKGWRPLAPTSTMYSIRAGRNFRIKDLKTDEIVYTLVTLRGIGDAVNANKAESNTAAETF